MRISIEPADPGYQAWRTIPSKLKPVVTVDGLVVERCLTADTATGYVLAHAIDAQGMVLLNSKRNAIVRRQLHGSVEIVMRRRDVPLTG